MFSSLVISHDDYKLIILNYIIHSLYLVFFIFPHWFTVIFSSFYPFCFTQLPMFSSANFLPAMSNLKAEVASVVAPQHQRKTTDRDNATDLLERRKWYKMTKIFCKSRWPSRCRLHLAKVGCGMLRRSGKFPCWTHDLCGLQPCHCKSLYLPVSSNVAWEITCF